jgi:hypothetical protein
LTVCQLSQGSDFSYVHLRQRFVNIKETMIDQIIDNLVIIYMIKQIIIRYKG